ncbi:MAG: hypothetical protein AB7P21_17230 [Lautropia sp.]
METPDDLVAEMAKLGYGQQSDSSRLLGMVMALAAEVFVLKAQNERLRRALQERDLVTDAQLAAAGDGEDMQAWLAAEEQTFTRAVLMPLLHGDRSIDATAGMRAGADAA